LKQALVGSPVLRYFDPELQTIVHSDSSAFVIGGWIGQVDKKGEEHPILDGRPFIAKTDHRALQWLQTQARLSKRQAGWIQRLQEFDMTIEYAPGKSNHVADALSRRPDFMPNCPKC